MNENYRTTELTAAQMDSSFENTVHQGTLSCLRQFLATESLLKVMKNAFYFTIKALFVLKIFKLPS